MIEASRKRSPPPREVTTDVITASVTGGDERKDNGLYVMGSVLGDRDDEITEKTTQVGVVLDRGVDCDTIGDYDTVDGREEAADTLESH